MANDDRALSAPHFLIETFESEVGSRRQLVIDARALHERLNVGKEFSTWMRDRIDQFGFVEDEDYSPAVVRNPGLIGGRPRIEYRLTLETAKHLAMADRSEVGRQVRAYFIEVERQHSIGTYARVLELTRQNERLRNGFLSADPRMARAVHYHSLDLTNREKALLMGWRDPSSWTKYLKKMADAGLIDWQPDPERVALGVLGNQAKARADAARSRQMPLAGWEPEDIGGRTD